MQPTKKELSPLSYNEVNQCSYTNWYKLFEDYCWPSEIINLDKQVVNYLKSDDMKIPDKYLLGLEESQLSEDEEVDDKQDTEGSSEEDIIEIPMSVLDELNNQVDESIKLLGGNVFPKLNWSTPKDAIWIAASKNLKCYNLGDILLLLKSSDDIEHDLNRAFELCYDKLEVPEILNQEKQLVLKTWINIEPGMEFRCFVLDGELIGICQRDVNYYHFLKEESEWIIKLITNFFKLVVKDKFPLAHYALDVYVIKSTRSVKIVDFNTASKVTHPLLFEWEDLIDLRQKENEKLPKFKIIKSEAESMHARSIRSGLNSYPMELTNGNSEISKVLDDMKLG